MATATPPPIGLQMIAIIGAIIVAVVAVALGFYIAPQYVWTRADAAAAVEAGSRHKVAHVGNSRSPCRTAHGTHIFGYTLMLYARPDLPVTGSVCWDVFKGRWEWRVDPPYQALSSDPGRS